MPPAVAAEAAEREAAKAAGQRSGSLSAISRDLDLGLDLRPDSTAAAPLRAACGEAGTPGRAAAPPQLASALRATPVSGELRRRKPLGARPLP